uniref:Uncharacterized protein n=3 Tax=Photinus pyralis TaxID=7054 RepID=A0A1Y1LNA0_PHOPY
MLYCPPVSDSDREMNVIESIFLCCLTFNTTFSEYKRSGDTTAIRTKVEEFQTYVHQVSELSYEKAVVAIKKERTAFFSKDFQVRYIETIVWGIIKEAAKHVSVERSQSSKGRLDDFTQEEKTANEEFMKKAGYKTGKGNQRLCRRRWKNLYDMREAGIDRILLYRTPEFNSFCEKFPSDAESTLVDTVMSWEKEYGPQIGRLEDRIKEASRGDRTERSWLNQPNIADRLEVPKTSWNSGGNHWYSKAEAASFKSTHGSPEATSDQLGDLSDDPAKEVENRNMTLFITLNPKSEKLISVCPMVTIKKGDFLGVFAGHIRYSESFDKSYGIGGPLDKLWLDYSQVTGMLNLMRVSRPGGDANVHLLWERIKPHGESQPVWRVVVRALREIKPLEEVIRCAHDELQYIMHQEPSSARRGFLRVGC